MRVYVLRHGESRTNQNGLWTGWLDEPLTEKGRADARKAAELLKNVRFDRVFASDLERAVETAKIVTSECGCDCEPEITSALREIDVGEIAGKPWGIVTDEERRTVAQFGYGIFGGETSEQFRKRVDGFKKELEKLDCQNVAVFSHAGLLRDFLDSVIDTRHPRNSICCNNCTVAIFEYADSHWRMHSWINLD